MFVELQDPQAREAMYRDHESMIKGALVIVFEFEQEAARAAVDDLIKRLADAPVGTRDALVHDDPVKIAAEIAGKSSLVLDQEDSAPPSRPSRPASA